MTSAEQKDSDDIKLIGEVRWGFKHSGYVSGLEKLGDKIGFSSWKRTGIDYSPVYWFCREVAIATRNSNNCQSDPREDAYELVQRNAMQSWKKGIEFKKLLLKDKDVKKYLSSKEIKKIFDLKYYLKNVDYIFKRVFG